MASRSLNSVSTNNGYYSLINGLIIIAIDPISIMKIADYWCDT